MTKNKKSRPACGCRNCSCRSDLRCRCHDYNALLALALWDYTRSIRRGKKRS